MKKFVLIFLIQILYTTNMKGQIYKAPSKNFFSRQMQVNIIGQYRIGADGLFHYHEMNGREISSTEYDQYTEGLEMFYCYDKSNNMYYFYTENTIGYYNPQTINYINYMKRIFKKTDVKNVKEKDTKALMDKFLKEMNIKYERKNDSIAKIKRAEREKFVKDSIETALRKAKERERKAKEQEEYRKSHDWRDLSMSKTYSMKCEFCDQVHYKKDYRVMFINTDTIYYLLDKPDISYLGVNLVAIHYSTFTRDFKNDKKFKEYINIWQDSIANNNNFSNKKATIFNFIQYSEFKDKVYSVAPNGFIQNWGWHLNSAQGIEPYFSFFNSSKKTIKYVDLYFSVYNAVGDRCYLRYERSYIGNVRGVGPVEPFEAGSWNWDRATHYTSGDASEMRIVKLVITYMDGTTKTIPNNSIIYDNQ